MQLVDELYDFVQQKYIQPAAAKRASRVRMTPPERLNLVLFVGFWFVFVGGALAVFFSTFALGLWSIALAVVWGLVSYFWYQFGYWHAKKYDGSL